MQTTVSPATELEQLFAANNEENKTLRDVHGGRRRPTPRPVEAFLKVGDVVGFYAGSKHRWMVSDVSENFAVLTTVEQDKFGDLQPIYTIISWADGHRGPHSSWGHDSLTAASRFTMLAELESGGIELSTRRALFLDIKTVQRDGKFIVRKAKQVSVAA